ncbi:MAG: selenium-dependent molybdenum cofactor biosynthesis protein YqeB [Anaerolineae bacterium]
MLFADVLVLIKGAGDLASGVAYRLYRSGFPIVMTELPTPLMVRRAVSFGTAVYDGEVTIEGVTARRVDDAQEGLRLALTGQAIPVLVDPEGRAVEVLKPRVLVDGIMAKHNTGTRITDAPLVIALGPGFTAGVDCHAAIETNRGHWLARIIYQGSPQPDTKTPGKVKGYTRGRVIRAPADGYLRPVAQVGDRLRKGDLIGHVNGHEVRAMFDGVLRGLIHPQVRVHKGLKIGDLDPRDVNHHCFTISEKSFAIGGAVLEAILAWLNQGG